MQRGRFAQEFLAELMREPRALRVAHLGERARWLRSLKVGGREELLFEFELHLRALERAFARKESLDGRPLLGQDFSDDVRAVRDTLHRAEMVARRLTATTVEQAFQLRSYLERQAEETRRSRLTHDLVEQRTPEESLLLLRQGIRALMGLSDQLLRNNYVTYQAWTDLSTLGEQMILSSKYFRPAGALEFRTEYDRVGSVRLLELVRRVGESRARKALALGFLASFRLLRYLRYIPAKPVAAPRRALLTALLVREEATSVANYLATDLPRLVQAAAEAPVVAAAAGEAAELLREALSNVTGPLAVRPASRDALELAREQLSEGAKAAAAALARAVEPEASAAEIFDGQRARRDRAERLRGDLWLLGQLLRGSLDALFPAMKGSPTRAVEQVAALVRFTNDFRQMGYHLLRAGDHEPFDRFLGSLEALTHAAPSPARDRHLYLECRRFLTVVERALALVNRRAELVQVPVDETALRIQLQRYQRASTSISPALDTALADQLLAPPTDDDPGAPSLEQTPPPGEPPVPHTVDDDGEAELELPPFEPVPQTLSSATSEVPPEEGFDPDTTRRIWRGT